VRDVRARSRQRESSRRNGSSEPKRSSRR
jgi:hypothetical protein